MPTIVLLQARLPSDPMLMHERSCFMERCGLPESSFHWVNMTSEPLEPEHCLQGADVVMIGGSGDFSVVEGGFAWHEPMLQLLRSIAARRVPTFGSCFGHQALIQSLGGTLVREGDRGEVGTFPVTLHEAGRQDPLFGRLPETFMAQLGHLDRAIELPAELDNLASSELCEVQATRLRGTSIVTTQFHPELTEEGNLARWLRYIHHYKQPGETLEETEARARSLCHPSPHSSDLLGMFLRHELGWDTTETQ